jgi:uncharacterized protein YyaL (SSP411 family)
MRDPNGGFHSTQDADSEGVEGKFYVWDLDEFAHVTGPDADLLAKYLGVTEEGNFEGRNILNVARPPEIFSRLENIPVHQLEAKVQDARKRLYAVREKRVRPGRDEKVLTDCNGMMLRSFAEAAAYLGHDDYRSIAESNASFILNTLWNGRSLLHNFKDGRSRFNGYLDDYANVADGLLALYQLTFDSKWLDHAVTIVDVMIDQFWDSANGGFFFTGREHENLIARNKDYFDNATPSGNSVAADVLLRLAAILERPNYREKAEQTFQTTYDHLRQYGSGFGRMLSAIDFYIGPSREIAIAGKPDDFVAVFRKQYMPRAVIAAGSSGSLPLLQNRPEIAGKPTAYVCENFVCKQPVTDPSEFEKQITE